MNSCAALPGLLAVDRDVVDVARVDVADRALDQAGFFVDQRGGDGLQRVLADVVPQPQQILAVALDFRLRPLRAGGADDHAHPLGDVELDHDLLQPAAIGGGGDFPGNAAAARRVRHQHREPAGERKIRGQRRAFGSALLLHHLDQQDLAAMDDFLDVVVAQEARRDAALGPVVAIVAVDVAVVAADGFGRRFLGDRAEHVEVVAAVRLVVVGERIGFERRAR